MHTRISSLQIHCKPYYACTWRQGAKHVTYLIDSTFEAGVFGVVFPYLTRDLGRNLTNRLDSNKHCADAFEGVRILVLTGYHIDSFAGIIQMLECDGDQDDGGQWIRGINATRSE